MGEDIHVVIEHRTEDGRWECAMELHDNGRSRGIFERIRNKGYCGLPSDYDPWTKHLLNPEDGIYGHGWLPFEDFIEVKHASRVCPSLKLIAKKHRADLRVVFAFDN